MGRAVRVRESDLTTFISRNTSEVRNVQGVTVMLKDVPSDNAGRDGHRNDG